MQLIYKKKKKILEPTLWHALWHGGLSCHLKTPASHIGVLATLLLVQLPTDAPWKVADDGPSACVPATHMRDPDGVLGSWLA